MRLSPLRIDLLSRLWSRVLLVLRLALWLPPGLGAALFDLSVGPTFLGCGDALVAGALLPVARFDTRTAGIGFMAGALRAAFSLAC